MSLLVRKHSVLQRIVARSSRRWKSTVAVSSPSSLNENNMIHHHMNNAQPDFQWDTFNGKIPVLKESALVAEESEILAADSPKTSILMEMTDRVGVLHDVLKYFWKHDINIVRIESRPKLGNKFDFFIDFEGSCSQKNVQGLI